MGRFLGGLLDIGVISQAQQQQAAGGGVPDLPTNQLVGHYKSDEGITLTGAGTAATVHEWLNQQGNAHHLTQPQGTSYEPTYVPISTAFGGKPMLYGNSDALHPTALADDFVLTESGKFTYAFVFKTDGVERYIWDARGRGSGQTGGTAGYTENGIETTSGAAWQTIGPGWMGAGYGGPDAGLEPYARGSNAKGNSQYYNHASGNWPNLWGAGLEIWICVNDGSNSYWSCNGNILGFSNFVSTQFDTTKPKTMDNFWPKADKLSPSIFSGYYNPTRGYGQGAMAELLVYDKALSIEEHNDLLDNLVHKYGIVQCKRLKKEEGDTPLDMSYEAFKYGAGTVINSATDVSLNSNSYNQNFAISMKHGIDFTRPGKYEFKFGPNPAGGATPIYYPSFSFVSPGNAMLNYVNWTTSGFPDMSSFAPSSYVYWADTADCFHSPGIMINKNADTTYSFTIGCGDNPAYYRIKDWTVFTAAGATGPFTVRIEWPGGATWQGWKWYIDDVLVYEATYDEWYNVPNGTGTGTTGTPYRKNPFVPGCGYALSYGRIGRLYDHKLLEGSYVHAPWNYEPNRIPAEGLVGHWDAGSGVTLQAQRVVSWEDKINGHSVEQAISTKQPTFVSQGFLNNLPAIEFDNSLSQILEDPNATWMDVTKDFTVMTVFKPEDDPSQNNFHAIGWADGSNNQGFYMLKTGGVNQTYVTCQSPAIGGGTTSGYVNNPIDFFTVGGVYSVQGSTGESKRYYIRGNNREFISSNAQGTYNVNQTAGFGIGGGRNATASDYFKGQIMEMIVWDRLLSLSELQAAEKSLMYKYKIFG